MKRTVLSVLISLLVIGMGLNIWAAERLWSDMDGKSMEAEYVQTIGDKVVLRTDDGALCKVSLKTLSLEDRKYLMALEPPRIEIKVTTNTDRSNESLNVRGGPGAQIQHETILCRIDLKKRSSNPYDGALVVEAYLIGKMSQGGFYAVLNKSESEFSFTNENGNEHRFFTDSIELKKFERGASIGVEYDGYLVVVKNLAGDVIEKKSSKLLFAQQMEAILTAKKSDRFDQDFLKIVKENEATQSGADKEPAKKRRLLKRFAR